MDLLTNTKARPEAKEFQCSPCLTTKRPSHPHSCYICNQWPIQQLDVNNAFLNGLPDEVYMVPLPRFETVDKSNVCKLNTAHYGLKQIPQAWLETCFNSPWLWVCFKQLLLSNTIAYHQTTSLAHRQLGALDYFLAIKVQHLQQMALSVLHSYIS
ncbi:Copia protein, partial [Mucuna pruriens]